MLSCVEGSLGETRILSCQLSKNNHRYIYQHIFSSEKDVLQLQNRNIRFARFSVNFIWRNQLMLLYLCLCVFLGRTTKRSIQMPDDTRSFQTPQPREIPELVYTGDHGETLFDRSTQCEFYEHMAGLFSCCNKVTYLRCQGTWRATLSLGLDISMLGPRCLLFMLWQCNWLQVLLFWRVPEGIDWGYGVGIFHAGAGIGNYTHERMG